MGALQGCYAARGPRVAMPPARFFSTTVLLLLLLLLRSSLWLRPVRLLVLPSVLMLLYRPVPCRPVYLYSSRCASVCWFGRCG